VIDVAAAAAAFLALIEDTAADADPEITHPARRYVAAGTAGGEAHDCEQVTVALVQLGGNLAVQQADGTGLSGDAAAASLPSATLRAEIVRAHPGMTEDGNPPSADALNDAGLAAMADAALLHAVRSLIVTTAALTGGDPTDVRAGPVVPSGPSGEVAGMTLTVAVTLAT
jgi:hypothetical protein